MTIVADPVDCSSSLVPNAAFAPPAAYPYNSAGVGFDKIIAASYEDVFDHTLKAECQIDSCILKNLGCCSVLTSQTDLETGTLIPFPIKAI